MENITLIQAIEEMKKRGVKTLSGMVHHDCDDIEFYLNEAKEEHETAVKYAAEGIETWQYCLDHENDHALIDIDGHLCIVTHYGNGVTVATWGDFASNAEMNAAYDEYRCREMAAEAAREQAAERSDIPYEIRYAIALNEVHAEMAKLNEEFNAAFPIESSDIF